MNEKRVPLTSINKFKKNYFMVEGHIIKTKLNNPYRSVVLESFLNW